VEPSENIFPMAEPMYWLDCADDVVADVWYYDPVDQSIKENPIYMIRTVSIPDQPTTTGSQTL
jgi:hypothetical protein